ncbi:group III truncated hemoglobin [Rasiella sp. SM2506]|uniref:group III truncated hemoglobin n=1 Tax=Rasiella sp. SM2506 TaxID=3423914 RepID=UPI003D7A27EE
MSKEIENREDIFQLVSTFYEKIRKDPLLGPIFNTAIQDWDAHLEHLTNFWESNLFFKKTYTGNPLEKHVEVDQKNNNEINEMHFGVWLNLWFETVNDLFIGERAQLAKNRARNMGTFIHLKIFEARSK